MNLVLLCYFKSSDSTGWSWQQEMMHCKFGKSSWEMRWRKFPLASPPFKFSGTKNTKKEGMWATVHKRSLEDQSNSVNCIRCNSILGPVNFTTSQCDPAIISPAVQSNSLDLVSLHAWRALEGSSQCLRSFEWSLHKRDAKTKETMQYVCFSSGRLSITVLNRGPVLTSLLCDELTRGVK